MLNFIILFLGAEDLAVQRPWKYLQLAKKENCRDLGHLESFFQDVVGKGGEGVILRDPTSLIQPGRSPGYLKHKVGNKNVIRKALTSFLIPRNSGTQKQRFCVRLTLINGNASCTFYPYIPTQKTKCNNHKTHTHTHTHTHIHTTIFLIGQMEYYLMRQRVPPNFISDGRCSPAILWASSIRDSC